MKTLTKLALNARTVVLLKAMSAHDVLEQVKALPPRERRKFFDRVHELETTEPIVRRRRSVRWPDAAARRRRIFGDKILPNLILLARDEERY